MNSFIFVSDFDGTLTKEDFYKIISNKYNPILGKQLETEWTNGNITVFEFLQKIFNSINITEEELMQDILSIQFDDYFKEFVTQIKNSGGDIIILSAGAKYYIDKLFQQKEVEDVKIISNPSVYKNGALYLIPDENSQFYCIESGIDKLAVVEDLVNKYNQVYYAGDGRPDFHAAKKANLIFARDVLEKMCIENCVDYIHFDSFINISNYLKESGVIK